MTKRFLARHTARRALGVLAIPLLIAGAPIARAGDAPGDIAGPWLTAKADSIVSFAPCGPGWCGRIAKVLRFTPGGPTTDVHNPDPALRNRPIEGLQLIQLDRQEGPAWRGTVYDPRSGRTYRVYVRRSSATRLDVQGCFAFICETQQWRVPSGR
jgi:uncharacterized protein (DUF2147 family)